MAASNNPSLSTLLKKTALDDHESRLSASETVLKANKSDPQAQHTKAVALLKQDKYEDAVQFFESSGSSLKEKAKLEYAYALYKSGRLEEAAKVASEISQTRGAQHVEAQARYRLEDYMRTAQIYNEIGRKTVPEEEADLRINQGAINAQGQWLGLLDPSKAKSSISREDMEAFETCYNAACGCIARGELAYAETLLKRAKDLCQRSDELSDEQRKEELLPIAVQQSYVLHRQGKTAEADAIAEEITVDAIPDLSTRKIASINLLLGSQTPANPFIIHKAFNSTPSVPESDKLFSYQSIPLASNEKTVQLQSFKFTGLADNTKKRLAKLPPAATSSEALLLSAFNAAALARNEVGKAAIRNVLPELDRRPNDIGLVVTLVQMYVSIGNTTSAIELVEALFKRLESATDESERAIRYHPGLVSILINLYKLRGQRADIKQELAKAAAYWRQKSEPPVTLLRAAGVSLLQSSTSSDITAAAEIFTKLYDRQSEDKATIAGYIASHALSDPDSVKNLTEKLTPVSKLISKIDIDSLESRGIPQSTNALAIAQAQSGGKSRKRAAPVDADNENKRIRKSRLPKNFDPNANTKPDPERWLPMRDRSYYRAPKGKKKGKKGDDRTQGGVINEDLDVSKQTQTKGGEVVTASGGGGGKKKKAKGKK